jgi:guanylate kinase
MNMNLSKPSGKVIIFSAPSGSGKSTVVNHLLKVFPKLAFSVSATTRKPRAGEIHGESYYFLEEADFKNKIKNNAFLETEEVYPGLFYGTLLSEVQRIWDNGQCVVFDVDVVGGVNLKQKFKKEALSVFLKPPSIEVLMQRLNARSTEVAHELKMRVDKAHFELQFESKYDVVLVNDVLSETFEKSEKLVNDFLSS